MAMNKDQTSQLLGALLTLIITVLGIFGYQIIVVKPQIAALTQMAAACGGG